MQDHAQSKESSAAEFPSSDFIRRFRAVVRISKPTLVLLVSFLLYLNLKRLVENEDSRARLVAQYEELRAWNMTVDGLTLAIVLLTIMALFWIFSSKKGGSVYILDFAVYKPPEALKCSQDTFVAETKSCGKFNEDSQAFQNRLIKRSGLGNETYLPPGLKTHPVDTSMTSARLEAEMVMFKTVKDLLESTGITAREVGVLIVNCSLFNPTPSLSAMIVNHFKMRSDIKTYNLSGMGCSAGMISVGLANEMLKVCCEEYAIIVSTENITQNWYFGNERSMLIPNVLFRVGGAAILLTNKESERHRAKYRLRHVVRTHMGANNDAFKCVFQKPDGVGEIGVELQKNLVSVAGIALQRNLTAMGPLVLPVSEMVFYAVNWVAIKLFQMKVQVYTPDFKQAFDHFCLHAGGRGVIEGLEKQLELPKAKVEPNFQTLEWYGNTSSATVWYSLAYIETVQGVQKGDTIWQLGFGSGFKCNSAVWTAVKNINSPHGAWQHKLQFLKPKKFV